MKFTKMSVVAAMAIAVAVSGCKYNKAAKGAGAEGGDAEGMDIASSSIDTTSQESTLSGVTSSNFEDLYARCNDVNFAPVYFAFDSTVVPSGELGKVDAVAQHLNDHSDRVVVVEGNCDERGSNEYNMSLGENRAIVVRNYLVQSGISADRIQTHSYGAEKPAVEGHDESAYRLNRRSEFAIFQK